MTQTRDVIRQATDLLSGLAWAEIGAVPDDELVALTREVEQLGRLVDAGRVFTAGEIAERSRYELGADGLSQRNNERKPLEFLVQLTRASKFEMSRRMRVGAEVRPRQSLVGEELPPVRPMVAQALAVGAFGTDAADYILRGLGQAASGSEATPENMDAAECGLVEVALVESADDVNAVARMWREALDPDGVEPRYDEIMKRRLLSRGRERNGITPFQINAAPPLTAVLDAILLDSLNPAVGPRFLSDEDRARAEVIVEERDGKLIERLVDPRTLGQKQHDILEGALLKALRVTGDGPLETRTVGSVTAVVRLSDLENGTGFGILEGVDEVIPGSVVQEIACDSGFFTVLLGEKGEPLAHGTLKRHATRAQRRAIVARDGDRCLMCDTTASKSVAHHVIFHSRGGPTDVANLVLLCIAHHHGLHQGHFEIKMVDGMPWIRLGVDKANEDAWRPAGKSRILVGAK